MRKQTAVYWAFKKFDETGNPEVFPPVEISCRWEDVQTAYTTSAGENAVSKATIYVDRDVTIDGFLWEGVKADAPFHPKDVAGAVQIKHFERLPNFRNTEILRTVYI